MLGKFTLDCNLRRFLDEALQNRLVCELMNSSIRRRLLVERTLTLKTATDLARTLESAEIETKLINKKI